MREIRLCLCQLMRCIVHIKHHLLVFSQGSSSGRAAMSNVFGGCTVNMLCKWIGFGSILSIEIETHVSTIKCTASALILSYMYHTIILPANNT